MHSWTPIQPMPEGPSINLQQFDRTRARYDTVPASAPERQAAMEKIRRRWAIETGVIEKVYRLEPAATANLERAGLDSPVDPQDTDIDPALLTSILADHAAAYDVAIQQGRAGERITRTAIRQLHQALVAHQPTYRAVNQFGQWFDATMHAGAFKTLPNNPTRPDGEIHQYCPPEHVDSELDRLLDLYNGYEDDCRHPVRVSAWLHHRFSQIHPFQDGNGRVARALQTWHLAAHGLPTVLVTRDNRTEYIETLEAADDGDLYGMTRFSATSIWNTMAAVTTPDPRQPSSDD